MLREYAQTQEEYAALVAEYETLKKYYDYIRVRRSNGKLSEELCTRCKEGNVRGVFGYPTETGERTKAIGVTEEQMDRILSNYGTFENFVVLYRKGEVNREDIELAEYILKNVVDIDFSPLSSNYDALYCDIFLIPSSSRNINLYSSKKLKEAIQTLTPQERRVIEERYSLSTGEKLKIGYEGNGVAWRKTKTLGDISEELNVGRERIRQIEAKALRKLRHPSRKMTFQYYYEGMAGMYCIGEAEIAATEELIARLYAENLLLRNQDAFVAASSNISAEVLEGIEELRYLNEAILESRIPRREIDYQKEYAAQKAVIEEDEFDMADEIDMSQVEDEEPEVKTAGLEEARKRKEELEAQVHDLEAKLAEVRTLMRVYDEILGEKSKGEEQK